MGDVITEWFGNPFRGRHRVAWKLVPTTVLWAVGERNESIFVRKLKPIGEVFENAKVQLIGWHPCARSLHVYHQTTFTCHGKDA